MLIGRQRVVQTAHHHAARLHHQHSTMAALQVQQQRMRQAHLLALPRLQAAAALAGAPELTAGLGESPETLAAFVERVRAMPAEDQRKILHQAEGAIVQAAYLGYTLASNGYVAAGFLLLTLIVTLLFLRDTLAEGLRK